MKKIALVMAVIFALAVISGCGFLQKKQPTPEPTPVPTPPPATPEPTPEPTPEEVTPEAEAPTFESMKPKGGTVGTVREIDEIIGTGFVPMETKVFLVAGGNEIEATDVAVVDPTKMNCKFNLTGAALGKWDLKIVTPGGEVIEAGVFQIWGAKTPTPTPKPGPPSVGKSTPPGSSSKTPMMKPGTQPSGK